MDTWKLYALDGRKIQAIKEYRHQHGTSLRESKDTVWAWLTMIEEAQLLLERVELLKTAIPYLKKELIR